MDNSDVQYVADEANSNELNLVQGSVSYQNASLLLIADLLSQTTYPTTAQGMEAYLAHRLLAGPAVTLPSEFDASAIIKLALIEAASVGKPLAVQAKTWSLGISADSAKSIVLALLAIKRIPSSDSGVLFPPAPLRVKTPVSVTGTVKVGGDPAGISGAFAWSDSLGLVSFKSLVVKGSDTLATMMVQLPTPAVTDRSAKLDGVANLMALNTATEGDYTLVVVLYDGNGNNATSSMAFHVYPKEAPKPLAPVARATSPVDSAVFPFETAQVTSKWVVTTPQGSIDSVTVDGHAASRIDDTTWSGVSRLAPTGTAQAVVLRAHNTIGIWTSSSLYLTRSVDKAGPVVTWVSPSADIEVDNSVTAVTVRVKATDPSGVDTVLIGGLRPDSLDAAGEWVRKVPLTLVGSPMSIAVRAVDSAGNATTSNVNVTRQNPPTDVPPKVVLLTPASKTGVVLPFDSEFVTARWNITDPYGVDSGSVWVNGFKAALESGNNWSARVAVPATGQPISIALAVKNKNGISGGDVISIVRRADTIKPVAVVVAGSRHVGFDSATVPVSWTVSDNDSLVRVLIAGQQVDGKNGMYQTSVAVAVGDDTIKLQATDRAGNIQSDQVVVHRYQKMAVQKMSPSGDTSVSWSTTTFQVSWAVVGASSATIGLDAAPIVTGKVQTSASLTPGKNPVKLRVVDSAGRSDSSIVTITRRNQVALSLTYAQDTSRTLPDSVVIGAFTEQGASLAWSLDGKEWTTFSESFAQKVSGLVLVRAQIAGKDDSIVSLKRFNLYHANHAPVIELAGAGIMAKSYLGVFQAPAVNVTTWGLGDGSQGGSYEVQLFDITDSHFLANLSVSSQGILSAAVKIDTSILLKVRFRLTDNGGTANGGQNQSAWTNWLPVQLVDTIQDVNTNGYRVRRMPDGRVWMTENLQSRPINNHANTVCGGAVPGSVANCNSFGALYDWDQALNVDAFFLSSPGSVLDTMSEPRQGLCPKGWHVAGAKEWTALFLAAGGINGTDSTVNLRSNDSGWALIGDMSNIYYPGTGKYGNFLRPTDAAVTGGRYPSSGANFWLPAASDQAPDEPGCMKISMETQKTYTGFSCVSASVRCVMDH